MILSRQTTKGPQLADRKDASKEEPPSKTALQQQDKPKQLVITKHEVKEQADQTMKVDEKKEEDYNLKECKICLNAEFKMLNIVCRHLMMCKPCY